MEDPHRSETIGESKTQETVAVTVLEHLREKDSLLQRYEASIEKREVQSRRYAQQMEELSKMMTTFCMNIEELAKSSAKPALPSYAEPANGLAVYNALYLNSLTEMDSFMLQSAVESIPIYDGKNMSVLKFTLACKRALNFAPKDSEAILTLFIINRLRNRAYMAVQDEPCKTVTDLCDILRGYFGPSSSPYYYENLLSNIYQKRSEHVLDYIERVKELHTAILDCERFQKRDIPSERLASINSLALLSFRNGLIPEIRVFVKIESCEDLSKTFLRAMHVFREIKINNLVRQASDKTTLLQLQQTLSNIVGTANVKVTKFRNAAGDNIIMPSASLDTSKPLPFVGVHADPAIFEMSESQPSNAGRHSIGTEGALREPCKIKT
ncbi:hypothetical protein KM043_009733 [Ampulex compressa]|nr:hypothetical protein KM043_009733 [Ampulex compressa]